jgi:8-oxo-dGTP diphosphatase
MISAARKSQMKHTSDGISIDYIVFGLLRRNNSLVMVRQKISGSPNLFWTVPGGLVESGELIMDALSREIKEETGVEVLGDLQLVSTSQIDRPKYKTQTLAFIYEIGEWHRNLQTQDPDGEVLGVELVLLSDAIHRLMHNRGWPGIHIPLLAYLQAKTKAGAMWFFREDRGNQSMINLVR